MPELSPDEFAKVLNENGKMSPEYISKEDMEIIELIDLTRHAHSASGMRCYLCKGSGFNPPGGNFTCPHCHGLGFK